MPLSSRSRRSAAPAAVDARLPNLFIIGAPKAGTTFLHHALERVPTVYMSTVKEPGFFSSEREQRRGLSYYLDAYFARAAGYRTRGESTPWYLYSDLALERIAALPMAGDARFIVMVRRPAARARSMYLDQVRLNREARPFPQAVADEVAAMETGDLHPDVRRRYVWGGLYSDHIERWRERFGADRVHVMVLEELGAEPARAWADLATFLGEDLGDQRFDEVSERDRNRSGRLRWPRVDAFIRGFEGRELAPIEAAKRLLPPGLHRRVLQRFGRLNRAPSEEVEDAADRPTLELLDELYRPEVDRLARLIGKDLRTWWAAPGRGETPPTEGPVTDRPLHVLHLVARSHRRGAELVAVELADELRRRGHRNEVVALGPATDGGIEAGLVPLAASGGVGLRDLLVRVRKVRGLVTNPSVDVVLAHGGWAAQVVALAARRRGRAPILVWQRILGFPEEVWTPLRQRWWRAVAGRFDVAVALTEHLEAEMRRLAFDGPVWVIPNSRQPDRFLDLDRDAAAAALRRQIGVAEGVPLIGFVGHLVRQKRPERAIEAVAALLAQGCAVHLVVAGDGPLRPALEQEVRDRRLQGSVTFLGHRADVEQVFGGVELSLLTSEAEGIPGVAIESLMAGCPLVSFPVGGVRDVIEDGVTGVVLPEPDVGLMAGAVADLLGDPERRASMGREGRLQTSRFSASATAQVYAERLGALLALRRTP